MSPPLRHLLLLTVALGSAVPAVRGGDPAPEVAWDLGAHGRFSEAAAIPVGDGEEAAFTRALLRFNRQPRSDDDLAAAAADLGRLAREGSTRAFRARCAYYQARAETLRRREEPADSVAGWYETLWRDYADEPYGQRAIVHLLVLACYGDEPREAIFARVVELEKRAERLSDPLVRGQFHQVAARGLLHLGGAEPRALEHLLAAHRLGVVRREALGDLHVSIGQLAAAQGRPDVAREHFAAFLQEFPNDPRAFTIRTWLAALPPAR